MVFVRPWTFLPRPLKFMFFWEGKNVENGSFGRYLEKEKGTQQWSVETLKCFILIPLSCTLMGHCKLAVARKNLKHGILRLLVWAR